MKLINFTSSKTRNGWNIISCNCCTHCTDHFFLQLFYLSLCLGRFQCGFFFLSALCKIVDSPYKYRCATHVRRFFFKTSMTVRQWKQKGKKFNTQMQNGSMCVYENSNKCVRNERRRKKNAARKLKERVQFELLFYRT